MTTYTEYDAREIELDRVLSLTKLLTTCEKEGVEIAKVLYFQNGFQVLFKDIKGDAILHDHSYAKNWGYWETIGMPWDYGDVSTHDPEELASMLGKLRRGEWEE